MSGYERPKRFVATTHKGNGGWIHGIFWLLVGIGTVTAGATGALSEPSSATDACTPATVRPDTIDAAQSLVDAGWSSATGAAITTGDRIYPPGCESQR